MMFLVGGILGGLIGYGIGVVKTRYQLGNNLLNLGNLHGKGGQAQ